MKSYRHSESTKIKIGIANSTGKRPNREVLSKMYIDDKLSTIKIGALLGVSNVTVGKWLKYYKIPVRSLREASYGNKRALGHKKSEESRRSMSERKAGIRLSYEHRKNISKSLQSYLGMSDWQGFARPEGSYDRQRFTSVFRKKVLARDNYTCFTCKNTGGRLHVEHIKPWSTNPELRFKLENCMTLCIACHYEKTYGREYHVGAEKWGNTRPIIMEEIQC